MVCLARDEGLKVPASQWWTNQYWLSCFHNVLLMSFLWEMNVCALVIQVTSLQSSISRMERCTNYRPPTCSATLTPSYPIGAKPGRQFRLVIWAIRNWLSNDHCFNIRAIMFGIGMIFFRMIFCREKKNQQQPIRRPINEKKKSID